ncbi:hypothetical protein AYI68_g1326 [Smittium mucronatum]|uniref:WAC domain-containing protein n=1 Tax=Smittium mucronatum TaxID=133383 RepID=A0A1R0H5Q0_9FUNG|nr:hypothetical protein AYI68_g1326 [Smittium mucronatum]
MPLLNKEKFAEIPESDIIREIEAGKTDFWKIRFTKEAFSDYEQPIWESEHTKGTGLTYEDAIVLDKEYLRKKNLPLQSSYLTLSFLTQIVCLANTYSGTISNMVNDIHEKLKTCFFPNEIVQIRLDSNAIPQKGVIIKPIEDSNSITPKGSSSKSKKGLKISSSSSSLNSQMSFSFKNNPIITEYSVRILDDITGKLGPEVTCNKDQISRSMEIFSKKSLKSLLTSCGNKEKNSSPFLIEPYLLLYLGLGSNNLNSVESDLQSQKLLNNLIVTAKKNFDSIIGTKRKSKLNPISNLDQSTIISQYNHGSDIPKNIQFPFIKLDSSPLAIAEKKSNSYFNFLREKFLTIKKFPILDIDLLQYNYLISKKGILYEIDFEWYRPLPTVKENKPKSNKKQLKLSSNGTLELVDFKNPDQIEPKLKPTTPTQVPKSILPKQWPIPVSQWKLEDSLINTAMHTFIFFSWFIKPLNITGFTLDQYESSLGHGLGLLSELDSQKSNCILVPQCNILSSCLNSLLNVIVDERTNESSKSDLFSERIESFLNSCSDKTFFDDFFEEDSIEEYNGDINVPDNMNIDPEDHSPVDSINLNSSTNGNNVEIVDINDPFSKNDESDLSDLTTSDESNYSNGSLSDTDYHSYRPAKKFKKKPSKASTKIKKAKKVNPPSNRSGLRSSNPPKNQTREQTNNGKLSTSSDLSSLSDSDLEIEAAPAKNNHVKICGYKFDFSNMSLRKHKSNLLFQLGKSWFKYPSRISNNTWIYSLIGYLVEACFEFPQFIEILKNIVKGCLNPENISQSVWKYVSVKQRLFVIEKLQADAASCSKVRAYIDFCVNSSAILRRDSIILKKDLRQVIEEKNSLIGASSDFISGATASNPNVLEISAVENTEIKNDQAKVQFSPGYSSRSNDPIVDFEKEIRRLSRQETNLNKSLSELEKNLRKLQIFRLNPIGLDRYNNKYFYIDGIGDGLANPTSRIFVVPDSFTFNFSFGSYNENSRFNPAIDYSHILPNFVYRSLIAELGPVWASKVLNSKIEENVGSRIDFLSLPNIQRNGPVNTWECYSTIPQIDSLIEWLDKKGVQESLLLERLNEIYPKIVNGIRKRNLNLEKEVSKFNEFVVNLTPLISDPDRKKDMDLILKKSNLRLGTNQNICSFSNLSIFSEFNERCRNQDAFMVNEVRSNSCNFYTFDKTLATKFGEIPSKPNSLLYGLKNDSSIEFNSPALLDKSSADFSDQINDKGFESDFSDSNGASFKNKLPSVGLRTRSKISTNKGPSFVESYLQYR